MVSVAAFYRFVPLHSHESLKGPLFEAGTRLGVKGSLLIASEGVNGTVSAEHESLEAFIAAVTDLLPPGPITVKRSQCPDHPFDRLKIRLKREIVTIGHPETDPTALVGEYVDPKDWNAFVNDPSVTLVDVRNNYEIEHGTFRDAIDPGTDDFRQFPDWAEANLTDKQATIAMFCTGGIRCEKATSLLLARGYKNVFHLSGGILNYLEQTEPSDSTWQGTCYVFDQRGTLDHNLRPSGPNHQTKSP